MSQATPLVFNIELDSSEQYPLRVDDPDYQTALALATQGNCCSDDGIGDGDGVRLSFGDGMVVVVVMFCFGSGGRIGCLIYV